MANYKLVLRTDKRPNAEGAYPIHVRVIQARRVMYVSLGVFATPSQWRKPPYELSSILAAYRTRVSAYFTRCLIEGRQFDREHLRRAVHGIRPTDGANFIQHAWEALENRRATLSPTSYQTYRKIIRHLESFQARIYFYALTPSLARRFVRYLREKRGLSYSTVARYIRFAATIVNWFIADGLLDHNPFRQIFKEYPKRTPQRRFLTKSEVHKLESYFSEHPDDPDIRWVLFTIYTGLRYRDVAELRWKDIQGEWIYLVMHKTKDIVSIPLHRRVLEVLPERGRPEDRVWRLPSNQKTNPRLRRLLQRADIDKYLTFHELRHTFAILSLQVGIPLEVVSKLMGHRDLKTTQIYARIYDNLKAREMRKWDLL